MGWFGKKKAAPGGGAVRSELTWTRDMRLRMAAPVGAGWQVMEAGQHGDGLLAAIKALRGKPPRALALDARLYAVPAGQRATAEALAQRDWKGLYLKTMFAEVQSVGAEVVAHPTGAQGCLVTLEGRCRQPDQPMRMREWHIPLGAKLLVLSAAGAPEEHEASAETIELWLMNAYVGPE